MYTSLIISLLFLSHVIVDFYLQTEEMAFKKIEDKKIVLQHGIQFFVVASFITLVFFNLHLIIFIAIIAILHYWVDTFKIYFQRKYNRYSIKLFLYDQFIHMLTLFLVIPYGILVKNIDFNQFYLWISELLIKYIPILQRIDNNKWILLILLLTFYLFLINGGTIITTLFLKKVPSKEELLSKEIELIQSRNPEIIYQEATSEIAVTYEQRYSENNKWKEIYENICKSITSMLEGLVDSKPYTGGEVIGIIERMLIFTFIILGNYVSITFVIAAKSVARFKKIEQDSEFSEKFLIGTLSSTIVAIFFGIVFLYLKKNFN